MTGKHWLILVSFIAVCAAGCRELNNEYCRAHRDDPDCAREGDKCGNVQCQAPTPVCNTDTTACVECVMDMDCAQSRPICSAQNTCIECEADPDCGSGLCLPDGTCANLDEVAHVDGAVASGNAECSMTMPCATLEQALAVVPFRRYIKATGMIVNAGVATIDRKVVTIFGEPGKTTIKRAGGGAEPVLDIRHEAVVTLIDLEIIAGSDGHAVEIRDAPGPMVTMTRVKVRDAKDNGIQINAGKLTLTDSQVNSCTLAGINMMGGSLVMTGSQVANNLQDGVKASPGTQVEIRRSSITGNKGTAGVFTVDARKVVIESSTIASNTGTAGGLSIKGPLEIRNNIISSNGIPATTAIGGVTLESADAKFEFNTVADNSGSSGGVLCVSLIDLSNSIFVGSSFSGVACNVTYSLMATSGTPTGTGNKAGEPEFLSKTLSSPMFYRISPTSAARDSANPAAGLDVDIDGEPRPGVPMTRKDMGADEYVGP